MAMAYELDVSRAYVPPSSGCCRRVGLAHFFALTTTLFAVGLVVVTIRGAADRLASDAAIAALAARLNVSDVAGAALAARLGAAESAIAALAARLNVSETKPASWSVATLRVAATSRDVATRDVAGVE